MPYVVARNGRPYGKPKGLAATLKSVSAATKKVGPRYQVGALPPTGHPKFLFRLARRLRGRDYGEVTHAFAGVNFRAKPVEWLIKKVEDTGAPELEPPWAPIYLDDVNARIHRVARAAYAYDKDVVCLGTQVCKKIYGTSVWSQHAYGNAIDLAFRLPPPVGFSMARQYQLADYLAEWGDDLEIGTIIIGHKVWSPSLGWHTYQGQYHTHVHVDCVPPGTGWPECAR